MNDVAAISEHWVV